MVAHILCTISKVHFEQKLIPAVRDSLLVAVSTIPRIGLVTGAKINKGEPVNYLAAKVDNSDFNLIGVFKELVANASWASDWGRKGRRRW